MIPVHRIHELVRLDHITAAEGADILGMQRKLRHDDQMLSFFGVAWVLTVVALFLVAFGGCGDNVPPPEPDAGVTATSPSEPPPTACLPWPCPVGGPP